MQNKNIAFCVRADYISSPGGDTVQMNSWAETLRGLGNKVTFFAGAVSMDALQNMDAVFIWHLERLHESFQPWLTAYKLRKPVFLVPTYWRHGNIISRGYRLKKEFELLVRLICKCDVATSAMRFRSWSSSRKRLLTESTYLVANSESERRLLVAEGASSERVIVIPNIIASEEIAAVPVLPWKERHGIICVGHFCPRKNQYELIRAVKNCDCRITFLGAARPMHKLYYAICHKAAGEDHLFMGSVPHRVVLEELGRARLCISVSCAETPGISNLEAAALGCNLLLPPIEPVKEYFGNLAHYSSPWAEDFPGLLRKLTGQPPRPELSRHIRNNYCESVLSQKLKALTIPEGFL